MKSLFARILLWFLAATLITTFGFVVITELQFTATRGRGHLFSRLLAFPLEEATHAYETGGQEALKRFVDRFQSFFGAEAVFTDASGRDLLTGRERHTLIERAENPPVFRFLRGGPGVLARNSPDGRYWLFLVLPGPRARFSFFLPQYLWLIGAVILLSYGLAYHLTSPLRQLERAVERFGQGDFSARAKSARRDELGQLARAFDQMAERIQNLLASQRRLLLDISHELRSPLARLSVAVELARSGETENREFALNRIEKEAERLNSLVGELLQVTRAEGDPSTLHAGPLRLDQLVSELVDDSSVEAAARGCRVSYEKPAPIVVQGDAELLRRAVENVMRNAIRHAPQGTPVEVKLESDGHARVLVRDYGPGVPEQYLANIFEPFYRVETDRNRASGGVGLGLAIARRAVELHKGTIVARNAAPGLEVEIELPVKG